MIRPELLAAVFTMGAQMLWAQNPEPPVLNLPACEHTGDKNSCARVLACVGEAGLWFDGQARGWDQGILVGQRSDGVVCRGDWAYGGLFGSATAQFECNDGSKAQVLFYAQDPPTGTGIARGIDSTGRNIRAWTGRNVLQFLGNGVVDAASLPCTDHPIPIS